MYHPCGASQDSDDKPDLSTLVIVQENRALAAPRLDMSPEVKLKPADDHLSLDAQALQLIETQLRERVWFFDRRLLGRLIRQLQ